MTEVKSGSGGEILAPTPANYSLWEFSGADATAFKAVAQQAVKIFATEVAMKSPSEGQSMAAHIQERYVDNDADLWITNPSRFTMPESGDNEIEINLLMREIIFAPHNGRGTSEDDQLLAIAIERFNQYLKEHNIQHEKDTLTMDRNGY